MDIYAKIAESIIEEQEAIIGPVAIEQAQQIKELSIDWDKHEVALTGDQPAIINKLVAQYKELFGQVSVEVCKSAASKFISELPPDKQPSSLK